MVIVRHPLSRLVSAYFDMFVEGKSDGMDSKWNLQSFLYFKKIENISKLNFS